MNWPPPRPGQVCRTTRLVGSGGSVSSMWEVAWSAAESSSSLGSDPPLLPAGGQWGRPSPGWSTAFYGRLPRSALATCPNTMVPGRSAMSGSAADRRTGPRQRLLAHGPRGRCRCLPAGTGQATVTDPADLTRSPATRAADPRSSPSNSPSGSPPASGRATCTLVWPVGEGILDGGGDERRCQRNIKRPAWRCWSPARSLPSERCRPWRPAGESMRTACWGSSGCGL